METDAIIFLILSWGFTLGLLGFCVIKILKNS